MHKGHLELLRNENDEGEFYDTPRTILVDALEMESGKNLSQQFKAMAQEQISRHRGLSSGKVDAERVLRETMQTVGQEGRPGGQVRCVVSVSMLTEGWDANNVTHIFGVRAFGTQLLCEQVVGRALRRTSHTMEEFDVPMGGGRLATEVGL